MLQMGGVPGLGSVLSSEPLALAARTHRETSSLLHIRVVLFSRLRPNREAQTRSGLRTLKEKSTNPKPCVCMLTSKKWFSQRQCLQHPDVPDPNQPQAAVVQAADRTRPPASKPDMADSSFIIIHIIHPRRRWLPDEEGERVCVLLLYRYVHVLLSPQLYVLERRNTRFPAFKRLETERVMSQE